MIWNINKRFTYLLLGLYIYILLLFIFLKTYRFNFVIGNNGLFTAYLQLIL